MIKRALISVSDKEGIVPLAKELQNLGVELVSTGGTASLLRDAGLSVRDVSDVTGFPECLDGRVKTLHPRIHAGILADRSREEHMDLLTELDITPIDLIVVNLYPFRRTISKPDFTFHEAVENIDIGGPSMLRAGAKNHASVAVVTDPGDYELVLSELRATGGTQPETRLYLAAKVFRHTASYDALIGEYLTAESDRRYGASPELFPDEITLSYEKVQTLRYGENSHQQAAFYRRTLLHDGSLPGARQLHGKELSYNNISDADAALAMIKEFPDQPTVVAVKHANPCGIASRPALEAAWDKAYEADPVSIFGGIVALNRPVTAPVARKMSAIFLEIIIAPSFEPEALEILKSKKNLRILELPGLEKPFAQDTKVMKSVYDGLLVQEADTEVYAPEDVRVVTKVQPLQEDLEDARFAMKVCKHIKSNAICLVKDGQTLGVGPGQVNRITALEIAVRQAGEKSRGAILASDAFFPFDDCVEAAAAAGVRLIVQPGGSLRDQDSIDAADRHGIAMLFTGQRHFRH